MRAQDTSEEERAEETRRFYVQSSAVLRAAARRRLVGCLQLKPARCSLPGEPQWKPIG